MHAKLLQSCPTLCNPIDCSPPGSPVHGILQARILEWVAMPTCITSTCYVKLVTLVVFTAIHLIAYWSLL